MKRLIYGGLIVGALLALYGLIPSSSESKLYYKNKSNLEAVLKADDEPELNINPKKVRKNINYSKGSIYDEKESAVYNTIKVNGQSLNINNKSPEEIKRILADDCKDNCFYFTDENGNIYESVFDHYEFYDSRTDCFITTVRPGWHLLNREGEIEYYGRNESDETYPKPEELIEWHCMTGK